MRGWIAGLVVASFVVPAFAGDEVMAPYIGNTLEASDAGGVTRVHYRADHTWTAVGPQGTSKGTWSIKNGDELCVTQTEPAPPANMASPPCAKLEPHKVGDTWQWTAPGAPSPTTLKLVAGQ